MGKAAKADPPLTGSIPKPDLRPQVFLNFPFDPEYTALFQALVFTLLACGYRPRCALELDNAGEVRFEKIVRLMRECDLSVHDLSRKGAYGAGQMARGNMPFELGLWLGLARESRRPKSTLILETAPYDYRQFISDIAGQDIRDHGDEPQRLISQMRDWLNTQGQEKPLPGGRELGRQFKRFLTAAPALLSALEVEPAEATYVDWDFAVTSWLKETRG